MIKINTDTEKAEHSQSYTHELTEILECFYEDGVVLAELSGTDFRQRPHYEHNYYIEAARLLNAETHMPFAIVGGTRSLTDMWEAFSAGAAMVSMSRPLIREPDFPNFALPQKYFRLPGLQFVLYAAALKGDTVHLRKSTAIALTFS